MSKDTLMEMRYRLDVGKAWTEGIHGPIRNTRESGLASWKIALELARAANREQSKALP